MRSFVFVLVIAALLRFVLAARQDLWADELFSLAMATGHSLEHPASAAVPALGDFVEPEGAVPPARFRDYLRHQSPPAAPGGVVRAVLLSDTSPPLYYLGLWAWTLGAGTGDFALHAFSVLWALATLPLVWSIGLRLGTPRQALAAALLMALAPVSLYNSVEGRMYSLLWFASALTAWLTLRLHDRGGAATLAAWTVAAAAGLLTHYFYAFVWAASVLWLVFRPGRCPRLRLAGAVVAALLLVAPWYALVPESLARWRVTGSWLDGLPPAPRLLAAPVALGWSLVSGRGVWGGAELADRIGAVLVLGIGLGWLRGERAGLLDRGRDLLWLWAIATCTGPVIFDLLQGTATSQIARYALAGMPAGLLLVGLGAGSLPARVSVAALVLLVGTWLPGHHDVFGRRARAWEPYREIAQRVGDWAGPEDLVLVHSIPSGVLGIARYIRTEAPMAAWVEQLGRRRMPESIATLAAGRSRVALIRVHEVGAPAPEEAWLRANATVLREERRDAATVVYFALPPTRR